MKGAFLCTRSWVLRSVCAGVVLSIAGVASAEKATVCDVNAKAITVKGNVGTAVIPAFRGTTTTVLVPAGTQVLDKRPPGFVIEFDPQRRAIDVRVKRGAAIGSEAIIKAYAPGYEANLIAQVRAGTAAPELSYRLEHQFGQAAQVKKASRLQRSLNQAQKDAAKAKLDADIARQETATARQETADVRRELDQAKQDAEFQITRLQTKVDAQDVELEQHKTRARRTEHAMRVSMYKRLRSPTRSELSPAQSEWIKISESVRLQFLAGNWIGEWVSMDVGIDNEGTQPLEVTGIRVTDPQGKEQEVDLLDPDRLEAGAGGVLLTISARGRGTVGFAVKVPPGMSTDSLRIELTALHLPHPVSAQIPGYELRPVTRAEERRRRWGKQTIVSVRAMYGAFWIADGLGQNQLDATDFKGAAVRLTKGYNQNLAMEAEIGFGATGQARFPEMMIGEDVGELTRDATLGRVGFGGLVRFGDKFQPHARLGVAGQGASFGAGFTGSADMGDESSFEFSALVTFGGGIDVRLSEHTILGVGASAVTPLGGSDGDLFGRAFSFGGHFAYGW